MKLNTLSLKDKKTFLGYLSLRKHSLAAYAFENIYIWKSLYSIRWAIIEKSLCIFLQDKLGCFLYLPPLGEEMTPGQIEGSFRVMDSLNKNRQLSRIENLEKDDLILFKKLGFICQEKPCDYLYLRGRIAGLRGNDFKSKRSSLNYFTKHYQPKVSEFSKHDSSECIALYGEWMRERAKRNPDNLYRGMLEDSLGCLKVLLKACPSLEVRGLAVRIGGRIKGFTLGYKLDEQTFCVLYEVTDLSAKGLAQFIFREFCIRLKGYKYINCMDDSGLENLKAVKLSYHPFKLVCAYIAVRKDA